MPMPFGSARNAPRSCGAQHFIDRDAAILCYRCQSFWFDSNHRDLRQQSVAGYTIAIRAGNSPLPCWGLGNSLVGQNLGAGKPNRAERSAWIAACFSAGLLGSAAIASRSRSSESSLRNVRADRVRLCRVQRIHGVWNRDRAFLHGAGDTRTPARINFICYWLIQLPSAYLLSTYFGFGVNGAFLAISATQIILAVISVAVFRRGKWKLRRI